MTRTSVENSTDVFCYPSSLVGPNRQIRACAKICLLGPTKGAPLHEQNDCEAAESIEDASLRMARVNGRGA